jgi:thiamine-monophosphate kinase
MALNEFDLIAKYFAPLSTEKGAFDLQDDAATIAVPEGCELVISKDMLAENIHFFPDDPPDLIAKKALRTNLSDIAAKGAKPVGYFMGLAFKHVPDESWMLAFSHGLQQDQELYAVSLFGGDTTLNRKALVISITAFGFIEKGKCVRRKGAMEGDGVFVAGHIGSSAFGLALIQGKLEIADKAAKNSLIKRYLLPEPPIQFFKTVATYASSSMDISDGLIGDLEKMAHASGLQFEIDAEAVPYDSQVQKILADKPELISKVLTGGDDYAFAFTASNIQEAALYESARALNIPLSRIGSVWSGRGVEVKFSRSETLDFQDKSFKHF